MPRAFAKAYVIFKALGAWLVTILIPLHQSHVGRPRLSILCWGAGDGSCAPFR